MSMDMVQKLPGATELAPLDITSKSNLFFASNANNGKLTTNIVLPKEHLTEIINAQKMMMQQMMQAQQDAAKWSEGRAGAGTIKTAVRAFQAEKGDSYDYSGEILIFDDLGFKAGDLDGTYFLGKSYSLKMRSYNNYEITVNASLGTAVAPTNPETMALVVIDGQASWK